MVLLLVGDQLYRASVFFYFSEITLMESDILSDDFVETETFDLGTLEISKTCAKTFTFRKVELWVSFPAIPGFV